MFRKTFDTRWKFTRRFGWVNRRRLFFSSVDVVCRNLICVSFPFTRPSLERVWKEKLKGTRDFNFRFFSQEFIVLRYKVKWISWVLDSWHWQWWKVCNLFRFEKCNFFFFNPEFDRISFQMWRIKIIFSQNSYVRPFLYISQIQYSWHTFFRNEIRKNASIFI